MEGWENLKVALVCIAKDEDRYIDEWVRWHTAIGFDKAFVYANDWRIGREIENVVEIPFDGQVKQMEAYTDWLANRSNGFDWAAFFDVDEFLNTHDKHVGWILSDLSTYPAVGVNWRMFGDSGLTEDDGSNGVLSRFTKCETRLHRLVKSIVNLRIYPKPIRFSCNPHIPDSGVLNLDGKFVGNAEADPVENPCMELNHYFCKTWPEFMNTKMKRGRADCVADGSDDHVMRTRHDFDRLNFNDVENTEVAELSRAYSQMNAYTA